MPRDDVFVGRFAEPVGLRPAVLLDLWDGLVLGARATTRAGRGGRSMRPSPTNGLTRTSYATTARTALCREPDVRIVGRTDVLDLEMASSYVTELVDLRGRRRTIASWTDVRTWERAAFLRENGWPVVADFVLDPDRAKAVDLDVLVAADWCDGPGGRPGLADHLRTEVDRLLTWQVKDGRPLRLHEMTTAHIRNALRFVSRGGICSSWAEAFERELAGRGDGPTSDLSDADLRICCRTVAGRTRRPPALPVHVLEVREMAKSLAGAVVAETGAGAMVEFELPEEFGSGALQAAPTQARSPYVLFAQPKAVNQWSDLAARLPGLKDGDQVLHRTDGSVVALRPMKYQIVMAKQYFVKKEEKGGARVSARETPDAEHRAEEVHAACVVFLDGRAVPCTATFKTTKCNAATTLTEAVKAARDPRWAEQSDAHRMAFATCVKPFLRVVGTVQTFDVPKPPSGWPYVGAKCIVSPATPAEWQAWKDLLEDPDGKERLRAVAQSFRGWLERNELPMPTE